MPPSYNLKNSAVKRILQEAKELANEQTCEYEAHPLEDNIFEWHFTVIGPDDTDFEGGRYHGRILLPAEYPFKPPHLIFLTPNGRFELNAKVCLSITDHHPEFWQPAWGIRTVLLAVMGFFPTSAQGAVGGLDYPKEERQKLAKLSKNWKCTVCQVKNDDFIMPGDDTTNRPPVHTNEELPAFTFTTATSENTSSSSSSDIKDTSSSLSGSGTDGAPPSAVTKPDDTTTATSPLSSSPISLTTNTASSEASSSRRRGNISPQHAIPSSSRSASTSASSSTPQPISPHPGPPAWLDALIGACVMVLLYMLYQKYM
ncbi:ubiquitin-conjugating enzyme/RWD-like protein [Absidia repens]|uniref:Ubiquitin-conjugating enzyme/RWD-like protein n=1 Tax=Absidia repens TaxID=90262 RepID=A0A1X2I8Q2_9FUNG|nr:ubiquitin-conjugating enzyme/RWD-like protein [Absidia repens]